MYMQYAVVLASSTSGSSGNRIFMNSSSDLIPINWFVENVPKFEEDNVTLEI
jgi:hypothetical protein